MQKQHLTQLSFLFGSRRQNSYKASVASHSCTPAIASAGFTTIFFLLFLTAFVHAQQRPNIVWIMAEDMNNHLVCYGEKLVHTPNIDWLAANGVRYTNAFTTSPVCAPSRASIITGMYSNDIGTQHMRQGKILTPAEGIPAYNAVPPPDVKAFTEYLRSDGYFCTNAFKTDYQVGTPFTVWDNHSFTASWRDRPNKEQSFFSCFTFQTTHEINVWPDSTKRRFFREFKVDTGRLEEDVKRRPKLEEKYIINPADVVLPPYYPDDSIVRQDYARHLTNVSRMDVQIGELMQKLKEDGLFDNTIIVFMGDNGDGIPRHKRWLYDGGLHVPLIIYVPQKWRSSISGKLTGVDSQLISFVDLAPTMLSITGKPAPKHMQGKAFLGKQKTPSPRSYIYAARDRMDTKYDLQRAVRNKQFKYIKNYWPDTLYNQPLDFMYQMPMMQQLIRLKKQGKLNAVQNAWILEPKPAEELYDVTKDPYEIRNLAKDPAYKKVLLQMRKALEQWQQSLSDWLDTPEIIQAEKMWPGGRQPITTEPIVEVNNEELTLSCKTEGASIGYRYEGEKFWKLYHIPFKKISSKKLECKAVRYGYAESKSVIIN